MLKRDHCRQKTYPSTLIRIVATALLVMSSSTYAAIHVMSPIVEQGEFEIEFKADRTFDKNAALDNAQSSNISIGYPSAARTSKPTIVLQASRSGLWEISRSHV